MPSDLHVHLHEHAIVSTVVNTSYYWSLWFQFTTFSKQRVNVIIKRDKQCMVCELCYTYMFCRLMNTADEHNIGYSAMSHAFINKDLQLVHEITGCSHYSHRLSAQCMQSTKCPQGSKKNCLCVFKKYESVILLSKVTLIMCCITFSQHAKLSDYFNSPTLLTCKVVFSGIPLKVMLK